LEARDQLNRKLKTYHEERAELADEITQLKNKLEEARDPSLTHRYFV